MLSAPSSHLQECLIAYTMGLRTLTHLCAAVNRQIKLKIELALETQ